MDEQEMRNIHSDFTMMQYVVIFAENIYFLLGFHIAHQPREPCAMCFGAAYSSKDSLCGSVDVGKSMKVAIVNLKKMK